MEAAVEPTKLRREEGGSLLIGEVGRDLVDDIAGASSPYPPCLTTCHWHSPTAVTTPFRYLASSPSLPIGPLTLHELLHPTRATAISPHRLNYSPPPIHPPLHFVSHKRFPADGIFPQSRRNLTAISLALAGAVALPERLRFVWAYGDETIVRVVFDVLTSPTSPSTDAPTPAVLATRLASLMASRSAHLFGRRANVPT